jgi:hypothetical protein
MKQKQILCQTGLMTQPLSNSHYFPLPLLQIFVNVWGKGGQSIVLEVSFNNFS